MSQGQSRTLRHRPDLFRRRTMNLKNNGGSMTPLAPRRSKSPWQSVHHSSARMGQGGGHGFSMSRRQLKCDPTAWTADPDELPQVLPRERPRHVHQADMGKDEVE